MLNITIIPNLYINIDFIIRIVCYYVFFITFIIIYDFIYNDCIKKCYYIGINEKICIIFIYRIIMLLII
jgi:hypothetical protein